MSAKKPKGGSAKRKPGEPPKLSENGKPKSPQSLQGDVKSYLREEIQSALFKAELDDFIFRRNVRRALGIGDLPKFIEDFEEGLKRSGELQTKQKDETSKEELIYGKPRDSRPKVTKVSREHVLRPEAPKTGSGSTGKGKGKGAK